MPANTNQAVGTIRLDKTKAVPRFVHYALRSPECQDFIRRSGAQSAQPNFNLQEIGRLPIPDLSMPEQHAIAEILGAIDDRIQLTSRANVTLETCAAIIFKSWFVDFDPVRAKAEGREPEGMDAATAALFPSEFRESERGRAPLG
ncbi:MAG: restriction endonuclease subunit S [Acidobacteriaceae bacterium]